MSKEEKISTRRLLENERIFKAANGKIKKTAEDLLNYKELEEMPLEFFCECANEACRAKIKLTHAQYEDLHSNQKQFIVKPGHEIAKIEKLVKREPSFSVVEKFISPPKTAVETLI